MDKGKLISGLTGGVIGLATSIIIENKDKIKDKLPTVANCHKCNRKLTSVDRKYTCRGCDETFCAQCMENVEIDDKVLSLLKKTPKFTMPELSLTKGSYVLCPACAKTLRWQISKMEYAMKNISDVNIILKDNSDKPEYSGTPILIETDFYKTRTEAEKNLKILATYLQCNAIINADFYKDDLNGWQCIGYAVKTNK